MSVIQIKHSKSSYICRDKNFKHFNNELLPKKVMIFDHLKTDSAQMYSS